MISYLLGHKKGCHILKHKYTIKCSYCLVYLTTINSKVQQPLILLPERYFHDIMKRPGFTVIAV